MRRVRLLLLIILFIPSSVLSGEKWQRHFEDELPWTSLWCIFGHENTFYAVGNIDSSPGPYLTTTQDWKSWNHIPLPDMVRYMRVHLGKVYYIVPYGISIYRQKPDQTFESVIPDIEGMVIEDVISFQDEMYVAFRNGALHRGQPQTTPNVWTESFPFGGEHIYDRTNVFFFIFKDTLMAAVTERVSWNPELYRTKIYQRKNEETWVVQKSFEPESGENYGYQSMRPSVATKGDRIFLSIHALNFSGEPDHGRSQLWIGESIGDSFTWTLHSSVSSSLLRVALIFDQVYLMGQDIPLLKLNPQDKWIEASPERVSSENHIANRSHPVFVNNTAYVMGPELMSITKGVFSISFADVGSESISKGQKNSPVLSFNVGVNRTDQFDITLTNLGSAEQEKDLEKIILGRYDKGGNLETLGVFNPDPHDSKKWHLPTSLPIHNGDQLFIMVDVSPHAREQTNCIFSIDRTAIKPLNNTGFKLENPLVSPREIKIISSASALSLGPIPDVLIYPQPARNNVVFAYDLTSPSDVTIDVFDRNSVIVARLKDLNKLPTQAKTEWNVSQLSKGVYYALIDIQSATEKRRVIKKKVFIDR